MSCRTLLKTIALPLLLLFSFAVLAQDKTVTGKVTDSRGIGIPGISVTAKGSSSGTSTNGEGAFSISVPSSVTTLVFSSVGYESRDVDVRSASNVQVTLQTTSSNLTEVVVVGYGTRQKKDLTGSVTSISSRDFNKGPNTTPEQLIAGKVAGVQITGNNGAPGAGSRIRIRGGSSLNASNDPLIVVDGVPLDNAAVLGTANGLSLINPNDIESFNILKDASATAIYGSRASNGVIIITTKKGTGGKFKMNFSTNESVSHISKKVDVLSADEFRAAIQSHGNATQLALLGNASTDWQDVIYRSAFSTDNNISFSGGVKKLPYRVSLGYLNQAGILRTDKLERTSAALNLSPKFFKNHLSVDLNVKASKNHSHFADNGAIGSAVFYDPTHPVYSDSSVYKKFGGYYEWLDNSGNPNTQAPKNPLSMLNQKHDDADVNRSIGNLQLDYKIPFLPELRANLNLGYDVSKTEGTKISDSTLASAYTIKGTITHYGQKRNSKLLDFYLNYAKEIKSISSRVDVTAGYSYQDWIRSNPAFPTLNGNGSQTAAGNPFKTENTLMSYFGRLNYTYKDKYLLTGTVRRDGSSRFSPDNRWGTFPSAALAWRMGQEDFLANSKVLSDLKFRIGFGITGQQDIGEDYPYLARYTISDSSARYQLGNTYYFTLRPQGYDENIKWEETQTWNAGFDFTFVKGKISGTIDYYFKKTKDLLAVIAVPAGSNFTNKILTNVGNIENKGLEFVLNTTPVSTREFTWDANFNITWNTSKITNLSKILDSTSIGNEVGGIGGGVGNTVQIHTVGYNPFSFFVYKQVYDQNGNPVEGVYVDQNKDGVINLKDKYRYKSPDPKILLGFSSQFTYDKWSLAFTMRANFGNYMYNNFHSNNGTYANFNYPNYLGNAASNVLETNFTGVDSRHYWSDYYIENASFLKMDNLNVGYNFGRIKNKFNLRLSATIQNVFTITKYSGLDPEIATGIDNNFYPRPRVFSLGANLDL